MATGATTSRFATLAGACLGGTGVALGAFGAHALRGSLPADALALFDTASRYQLVHAAALLGVAALAQRTGGRTLAAASLAFALGIVLFSGSLYALALTGVHALGAVTPVGGLLLLAGWALLFAAAWGNRMPAQPDPEAADARR